MAIRFHWLNRLGDFANSRKPFAEKLVRGALLGSTIALLPAATVWSQTHATAARQTTQADATISSIAAELTSRDAADRRSGLDRAARLGTAAGPVFPQVKALMQDREPQVQAHAAHAVWQLTSDADVVGPALVNLLTHKDNETRQLSAFFLGTMGESAAPARAALHHAMGDADVLVRLYAAEAVTRIAPEHPAAVDVLVQSLQHADATARLTAAMALGEVHTSHVPRVTTALQKTTQDSQEGVRKAARLSLSLLNAGSESAPSPVDLAAGKTSARVIEFPATQVIPSQTPLYGLGHPVSTGQTDAEPDETPLTQLPQMPVGNPFEILKPVEPVASVVADTPEVVNVSSSDVSSADASLFDNTEVDSSPVVTAIETAEGNVGDTALAATPNPRDTAPVSTPAPEFLSPLDALDASPVDKLRHADAKVRKQALIDLGWEGPAARSAVTAILPLLDDGDAVVRAHAAKALFDIDPATAPQVVPVLAELLVSVQPGVPPLSAYILGHIGPAAGPAVNDLQAVLESTSGLDRLHVAEAIARIEPKNTVAVGILTQALHANNEEHRFLAAYALSETAPYQADVVVPELLAAREDQSPRVQQAAEFALESFMGALHDPTGSVQLAQAETQPALQVPVAPAPAPQELDETAAMEAELLLDEARRYSGMIKPISAVKVDIAPRVRDASGRPQQLPTNYGSAWLTSLGRIDAPVGMTRSDMVTSVHYAAPAYCHRPLYFEEINLERYGHNFGVMQPFVSAANFYGRLSIMPYLMTVDKPWECQYPLGHYRPGSCSWYHHHNIPWRWDAALVQAAAVYGGFIIID